MISIVICSVKPEQLARFQLNVAETIGAEYEIIAINNRHVQLGICQVYNEGLARAKFDIICFCHEDIDIETMNWGNGVINLLNTHPEIGLTGVAGAVYKSQYPNPWPALPSKYYRTNLVQQKKDGTHYYEPLLDDGPYSEVAVIDGCFIAGKKRIFELFRWNDELLKGFHLYDIDLGLRVGQFYKITVNNSLKIMHASEGNMNREWFKQSELFHSANKIQLPLCRPRLDKAEALRLEYFSLNDYIIRLLFFSGSRLKILRLYCKLFFLMPLNKKNLSVLKRIIRSVFLHR